MENFNELFHCVVSPARGKGWYLYLLLWGVSVKSDKRKNYKQKSSNLLHKIYVCSSKRAAFHNSWITDILQIKDWQHWHFIELLEHLMWNMNLQVSHQEPSPGEAVCPSDVCCREFNTLKPSLSWLSPFLFVFVCIKLNQTHTDRHSAAGSAPLWAQGAEISKNQVALYIFMSCVIENYDPGGGEQTDKLFQVK